MTTKTANTIKMARLLDRQANLWEIRERLAKEGGELARRELAHVKEGPWITISKLIATGWEEVAERLASHLGWQIFDREIVEEIARESHSRQAILSRLDEKEVGWLEDTLRRLAVPDDPGQHAYLEQMVRVVLALARRGRTILVGRGANWLLDPAYGVRLRLVAPIEMRAERLARLEHLSVDQAHARLQQDDAMRARFIRQVYGRDIDDPSGYDMILNLGSLAPGAAAEGVVAALRRKLAAH